MRPAAEPVLGGPRTRVQQRHDRPRHHVLRYEVDVARGVARNEGQAVAEHLLGEGVQALGFGDLPGDGVADDDRRADDRHAAARRGDGLLAGHLGGDVVRGAVARALGAVAPGGDDLPVAGHVRGADVDQRDPGLGREPGHASGPLDVHRVHRGPAGTEGDHPGGVHHHVGPREQAPVRGEVQPQAGPRDVTGQDLVDGGGMPAVRQRDDPVVPQIRQQGGAQDAAGAGEQDGLRVRAGWVRRVRGAGRVDGVRGHGGQPFGGVRGRVGSGRAGRRRSQVACQAPDFATTGVACQARGFALADVAFRKGTSPSRTARPRRPPAGGSPVRGRARRAGSGGRPGGR